MKKMRSGQARCLRNGALAFAVACTFSSVAFAQTAVLGNEQQVLVYPLISFPAGSCPGSVPVNTVAGGAGHTHGVGFYGSDYALVSYFGASEIRNVQLSTASTLNTINTSGIGYNGNSTIAVAPNLSYAIAATGSTIYVSRRPLPHRRLRPSRSPGPSRRTRRRPSRSTARRVRTSRTRGASASSIRRIRRFAFTIPGDFEAIAISPDGIHR